MTNEAKKCPNCGHQFKEGEEYCPNCDLFVPISDQTDTENSIDPNEEKLFKTFKEKKNEPTEDLSDTLFKHRTKVVEESEESIYEEDFSKEEMELTEQVVNELPNDINDDKTTELEQVDSIDNDIDEMLSEKEEVLDSAPILGLGEEIPETRLSNKTPIKPNNNKKKIIAGISAAVILIAGGSYFYSTQQKNATEKARLELISTTESDLSALYSSEDKVFLKEGITQSDLDKAKETLNKLKTKEGYEALKEEFDIAEGKFNKQQGINDLFKTPIMSGKELAENSFVKNSDGITLNAVAEEKDGFDILYNKAIAEAKTQKEALKAVEEKLAVVYKDDAVVTSATRDQYKEAETAINTLKDEEMKTTLTATLAKVDTVLAAAEKKKEDEEKAALAAQQEQERLAAIEAEKQAVANAAAQASSNSSSNNSSSSSSGTSTPGKYGNREDANINLSDAAWAWNPGIQNEVMTEVIRRGYVVEGGYSLVPKYIENGEGYYNLYATTNSKIFPNSKPQEFPLYVVTINVKTGSFFGNGPN